MKLTPSVSLRAIEGESDGVLARLLNWYTEGIPEVERIQWSELLASLGPTGGAYLWEVRDNGQPVGFAYGHRIPRADSGVALGYLQYLVIAPEARGSGRGAMAYAMVVEVLRPLAGLILEVEDPLRCAEGADRHWATRRITFYERLGLRLLDVPYVQPPVGPGQPAWPMRLMLDSLASDAEESELVAHFLRYIGA